MPSMYESDEEDDDNYHVPDDRDEKICSEIQRSEKRRRLSRYSLMRCLAWSQADEEINEKSNAERDGEEEKNEGLFVMRNNSVGCASFSSVHSAMIDSVHHPIDNKTRPIHWEQRVSSDRKLDSFLLDNKDDATFPKC